MFLDFFAGKFGEKDLQKNDARTQKPNFSGYSGLPTWFSNAGPDPSGCNCYEHIYDFDTVYMNTNGTNRQRGSWKLYCKHFRIVLVRIYIYTIIYMYRARVFDFDRHIEYIHVLYIWANYSDLTQPICPQKVAIRKGKNGTPYFRGKSRLVQKKLHLARYM